MVKKKLKLLSLELPHKCCSLSLTTCENRSERNVIHTDSTIMWSCSLVRPSRHAVPTPAGYSAMLDFSNANKVVDTHFLTDT